MMLAASIVEEGEKSEGASAQSHVDHSRPTVRSAVPWHEKLLLVSVLLGRRRMGHLPTSADASHLGLNNCRQQRSLR